MSTIFNDNLYGLGSNVTAVCSDTTNGNYLWVAFAAVSGVCLLKKCSAMNPLQVYYTVSVPVSNINAMVVANGYIFLSVNHASIFSYAYSVSNPLTTFNSMNRPSGITESSVALAVGASNIYFLTPGETTATPAKIVSTTQLNVYVETVQLHVSGFYAVSASGITVDNNANIWVVTHTAPVQLVRAWKVSGVWHIQDTSIS
jgi:hypothetical protein